MAFTLQSGGVAARGSARPSAALAARRGSFASAAPLRAACRAPRAALPARGAAVRVRAEAGACATRHAAARVAAGYLHPAPETQHTKCLARKPRL
jgi:hypothetical protein